jgi:hypothetical protein
MRKMPSASTAKPNATVMPSWSNTTGCWRIGPHGDSAGVGQGG